MTSFSPRFKAGAAAWVDNKRTILWERSNSDAKPAIRSVPLSCLGWTANFLKPMYAFAIGQRPGKIRSVANCPYLHDRGKKPTNLQVLSRAANLGDQHRAGKKRPFPGPATPCRRPATRSHRVWSFTAPSSAGQAKSSHRQKNVRRPHRNRAAPCLRCGQVAPTAGQSAGMFPLL